MTEHAGPGHGDVTLSLATGTRAGGLHYRSWTICACSPLMQRLDQVLPEPQQETWAPARTWSAVAQAALDVPGVIHLLNGEGS